MAQGDIRSALVDIGTYTNIDIRPAAGEHWVVKSLISHDWVNLRVFFYNGTTGVYIYPAGTAPPAGINDLLAGFWTQGSPSNKGTVAHGIWINNGVWLRIQNWSGTDYRFIYTAIQIK